MLGARRAAEAVDLFTARHCDPAAGPLDRRLAAIAAQGFMAMALPNEAVGRRWCGRIVAAARASLREAGHGQGDNEGSAAPQTAPARLGLAYCEVVLSRCGSARRHYVQSLVDQGVAASAAEESFARRLAPRCAGGPRKM